MSECQGRLDHWQVINESIERNKQERINWKKLLGMSLTRAVAKFKSAGLDAQQTLETLLFEHPEWGEEVRRRLKIGVCARFGEMQTAQEELK